MSRDHATERKTDRDRVFDLLSDLRWHPHHELARVGGNRYGARLHELRRLGYSITSEEVDAGGKHYRLLRLSPGAPQTKRVKLYLDENDASLLVEGNVTHGAKTAVADALGSFRANREKL